MEKETCWILNQPDAGVKYELDSPQGSMLANALESNSQLRQFAILWSSFHDVFTGNSWATNATAT